MIQAILLRGDHSPYRWVTLPEPWPVFQEWIPPKLPVLYIDMDDQQPIPMLTVRCYERCTPQQVAMILKLLGVEGTGLSVYTEVYPQRWLYPRPDQN